MYNLIMRALSFGRAATIFTVSRMGLKTFLKEVAGFIVIEEVVDQAAGHSQWVEQNKTAILSLTLLGSGGVAAFKNFKVPFSYGKLASGLFSKMSIKSKAAALTGMLARYDIQLLKDGVKIVFNEGSDFIQLWKVGQKLHYKHSGGLIGATVLAGGFAANSSEDIDFNWADTAYQLALVLADTELHLKEGELEARLANYDALSLAEVGTNLIRSFIRENPAFPSEKAVSILEFLKSTEQTHHGEFSLFAFVDQDGRDVIDINGTSYLLDSEGDTLEEAPEAVFDHQAISPEGAEAFELINGFYTQLVSNGSFSFHNVPDTLRYLSESFTLGDKAIILEWDEAEQTMIHRIVHDGLFSDLADGLIDLHDQSTTEVVNSFYEGALDYFGNVVDSITGQPSTTGRGDVQVSNRHPNDISFEDVRTQLGK